MDAGCRGLFRCAEGQRLRGGGLRAGHARDQDQAGDEDEYDDDTDGEGYGECAFFFAFEITGHSRSPLEALASEGESRDQWFRQTGARHSFLHGCDVVGHAPEFYRVIAQFGDGESGAWVAV